MTEEADGSTKHGRHEMGYLTDSYGVGVMVFKGGVSGDNQHQQVVDTIEGLIQSR